MATTVLNMVMMGMVCLAAEPAKKPPPDEKRRCVIVCKMAKDVKGEKKALATIRVKAVEGRPAWFQLVENAPKEPDGAFGYHVIKDPDEETAQKAAVEESEATDVGWSHYSHKGFSMKMTVRPTKNGKLQWDTMIETGTPAEIDGDRVRICTQRVRTIATLKPEEPLKVTMGPYTCEIQVQPEK